MAGAGVDPGSRQGRLLAALDAAGGPLTAREAGRLVGVDRHEARSLLHRLLDAGLVDWAPAGWTVRR